MNLLKAKNCIKVLQCLIKLSQVINCWDESIINQQTFNKFAQFGSKKQLKLRNWHWKTHSRDCHCSVDKKKKAEDLMKVWFADACTTGNLTTEVENCGGGGGGQCWQIQFWVVFEKGMTGNILSFSSLFSAGNYLKNGGQFWVVGSFAGARAHHLSSSVNLHTLAQSTEHSAIQFSIQSRAGQAAKVDRQTKQTDIENNTYTHRLTATAAAK